MVDRYEALERFARLRDDGVISDQEFAAEKAKLLSEAGEATTSEASSVAETRSTRRRALWIVPLALIALAILIGLNVGRTATAPTSTATTTAAAATAAAGSRVPSCSSSEARDLVARMVASAGATFASLSNVTQVSGDPGSDARTCAADLSLADGIAEHRTFRLLPASDGSSYQAELVGGPLAPLPQAAAVPVPEAGISASNETEEVWADACVGHYLGESNQSGAFSVDVTNRPLDFRVQWSDFTSLVGRPVRATANGHLEVTDYQFKQSFPAVCQGDQIELKLPSEWGNSTLVARRSTKQLQMSGDGDGE